MKNKTTTHVVPGMVHDPFDTPRPLPQELGDFLETLVPPDRRHGLGVICTPVTQPRSILGSQPLGRCVLCDVQVWLAPSTVRLEGEKVYVCGPCFDRALHARERSST